MAPAQFPSAADLVELGDALVALGEDLSDQELEELPLEDALELLGAVCRNPAFKALTRFCTVVR